MFGNCAECAHLDKSRKKLSEKTHCYLYGCNKIPNGHVCGWCCEDKELKLQGCSDFRPIQPEQATEKAPTHKPTTVPSAGVQLTIFDLI